LQGKQAVKMSKQPKKSMFSSPIVWGLIASVLFYGAISNGIFYSPAMERYFAGHWVEYIETSLFFIGVFFLYFKRRDVLRQLHEVNKPLLPSVEHQGQSLEDIPTLLTHLQNKTGAFCEDYLPRRLRDALDSILRRSNTDKLDEELKYLADLDSVRSAQSYSFVKIIIWAIPILGFLGTVIGITDAIGVLSPQQLEQSLPEVTKGLGVAFDTTAIALGFSMVLMFQQYSVDKYENQLLSQVESCAVAEICTRFPNSLAIDDPLNVAVQRILDALLPTYDRLVKRQVELWQATVDEAHDHWQEQSRTTSEHLTNAIATSFETSMQHHAQRITAAELQYVAEHQKHWTSMQGALEKVADKLTKQQTELGKQGELFLGLIEGNQQVKQLEENLNSNLQALTTTQQLQEAMVSLSATLQLLAARVGAIPAEVQTIELPMPHSSKKSRGKAA
jgi:biopolymer transport protein ExbB/TolQ